MMHDLRSGFSSIDQILRDHWDPLGVRDAPQASDEYRGQALQLSGLLARQKVTRAELVQFLTESERDLGVPADAARAARVVELILRTRG